MVEFDFYPHRCTIFRGELTNPTTGVLTPVALIRDVPCYVEQGYAHLSGDHFQAINNVHVGFTSPAIMPGDTIDITLENGIHYSAKIKQAYPVTDEDFGGQELKLYDRDAAE